MAEKIYFDHINEKTDSYFLEYSPPVGSVPFASLTVTYISDVSGEKVATDLEDLAGNWIARYPGIKGSANLISLIPLVDVIK